MQATQNQERRAGSQRRKDLALMRTEPPEGPDNFDRMLHAIMSQFTPGISPVGLALAWSDWSMHLAVSPGKGNEPGPAIGHHAPGWRHVRRYIR